jgi:hypothetical protein
MLGPFTVGENERFLGIECSSNDADLDVDMFLFHDLNGNRLLDGIDEQVASSASPTAIENILYNDPTPGAYWIFCQGWKVNYRTDVDLWDKIGDLSPRRLLTLEPLNAGRMLAYGLIDISLSFNFNPAFIVDINPVGELLITDPVISGRFMDGIDIEEGSFKVVFARVEITDRATVDADGFSISLSGMDLQEGVEYPVHIEAMTTTGLFDNLDMTLTAVANITEGEETAPEETIAPPEEGAEETLLSVIPGDGASVYDFRSVLIVYFSPEIRDEVEDMTATLDGVEITDSILVYGDGALYIPAEAYERGEHTFEVHVTLHDGRVIEAVSTFTVLSMGEEAGE